MKRAHRDDTTILLRAGIQAAGVQAPPLISRNSPQGSKREVSAPATPDNP